MVAAGIFAADQLAQNYKAEQAAVVAQQQQHQETLKSNEAIRVAVEANTAVLQHTREEFNKAFSTILKLGNQVDTSSIDKSPQLLSVEEAEKAIEELQKKVKASCSLKEDFSLANWVFLPFPLLLQV